MKLYKRNAKGIPLFWEIFNNNNNNIVVHYGVVGAIGHYEILNKEPVKTNEVSSRIAAKRKEGYKELSELYDNAPEDLSSVDIYNFVDTYLPKNNTSTDGFVLPMLAKVLTNNRPFSSGTYIGQYKINGLRCLIGAEKTNDLFAEIKLVYHSRTGERWNNLNYLDEILIPKINKSFLEMMVSEGAQLDGELYLPGYTVNDINSFVKNDKLPQHYQLQYWCYDIAVDNMAYYKRRDILVSSINGTRYEFQNIEDHLNNKDVLMILPDFPVSNIDVATVRRDRFISLGFEGLIVRKTDAEYQFDKRNNSMLKFKKTVDGIFDIIDVVPEGVRKNLCKFVLRNDINSELFECTINASHKFQEQILNDKDTYIGKYKALVEYRERSGIKNVPFHAKIIQIKKK